jgi:ABC-2 type transport system permease protein
LSHRAYIRFELLRTVRNRRFFILALGFPIVLYFLIAGPNRNEDNLGGSGLSAPLYYMVGLAAFGAMNAMISVGGRIATERTAGWNRQLRLTPLSARDYFRAKILTGYMTAITALILLFIAGTTLGVCLGGHEWLEMTGLILVGLVPFGALAILLGHLLTADAIGPAMGGLVAVLAVLGGVWFPISSGGALYYIGRALPSYWLVQASHVALGGGGWGRAGWLIVAAWSVVLGALAARAYRRDTARV